MDPFGLTVVSKVASSALTGVFKSTLSTVDRLKTELDESRQDEICQKLIHNIALIDAVNLFLSTNNIPDEYDLNGLLSSSLSFIEGLAVRILDKTKKGYLEDVSTTSKKVEESFNNIRNLLLLPLVFSLGISQRYTVSEMNRIHQETLKAMCN